MCRYFKNISIKAPKATHKGKSPTPKKYLHIANTTQCHKYKEYKIHFQEKLFVFIPIASYCSARYKL